MHILAALALTGLIAGGVAGLGDLLGGRSAADRWVRGWMAAWWVVALAAEAVSPRAAAAAGGLVLASGLVWGARRVKGHGRTIVSFGLALAAAAPFWLLPPYFYDTLVYHLGLPWSWLANGSFATVPHNLFSHFPLAGQTLFLLPVAAGVPEAAAGLHWTTLLVALAAMTRLGRTLGAGRWSWFAPVLLLACWHAVWVSTVAAVDMLVVVAVLAMTEHVIAVGVSERGRAIGIGCGVGLALSVKYTALVPAAAVVVAAAPAFPAVAAWAIAIGAASSSFWWVRNLGTTGNPVFPLLWRVFGGHGWTSADDERYTALVREGVNGLASLPRGVVHLVRPPEGLGWWALAALPLVALALTARNGARGARRRLASASAMMLVGWLVTSQTTRYALPLAALVAVLAAAGLGDLSRPASGAAAGALGAVALHGVVGLGGFFLGVLGFSHAWSDVEGWRHRVTVDDPVPAYRTCDRALPPDARVLIVGEGRSWGMPRPYHASSAYDLQLAQEVVETSSTARDAWSRLRAARFTHLLVNWGEASRLGGVDYRVLRWAGRDDASRWRELLEKFSSPVFAVGDVEVRALAADEPR